MKNVKAVFFDLYGTLLDYNNMENSNQIWIDAFYELAGLPNKLSIETQKEICAKILSDDYEIGKDDSLTTYEAKIKYHFGLAGISFTREELKYIADETVGRWQENIFLYKDTIPVLQKLKPNKKLVLISNFDHTPHVKRVIERENIAGYFDLILISDEVGINKPDKRIFEIALRQFNLTPEEVVFVGDSYKDDILGARSADILPVLIKLKESLHQHNNPNGDANLLSINSLSELISILS